MVGLSYTAVEMLRASIVADVGLERASFGTHKNLEFVGSIELDDSVNGSVDESLVERTMVYYLNSGNVADYAFDDCDILDQRVREC